MTERLAPAFLRAAWTAALAPPLPSTQTGLPARASSAPVPSSRRQKCSSIREKPRTSVLSAKMLPSGRRTRVLATPSSRTQSERESARVAASAL